MTQFVNIGLIVLFVTLVKGDPVPCENQDYGNMNAVEAARLLGFCSMQIYLNKYEHRSPPIDNLPAARPNKTNCTFEKWKNEPIDLLLNCFFSEINFDDDLQTVSLKLKEAATKFAAEFTNVCPITEMEKLTFAQSMNKYRECTVKQILLGMANLS
ncbi:hypothetical protein C0J52_08187 [Blattella germanica]|nr:hypothetical protein C0J52_08187 [Blattella germanica]